MLNACNQGNLMATDLAEWFVSNLKISFRLAYKITTKIIKVAEKNNCQINNLKVEQLNFIDSNFRQKIKEFLLCVLTFIVKLLFFHCLVCSIFDKKIEFFK